MKIIILITSVLFFNTVFSQKMDTIYTHNKKIACNIKEVADENVKYSYPNEDILISINKNRIVKIIFSSGREEIFAESMSFKKVSGWEDWENVLTTNVDDEVDGLFKLGDVSSKVKAGSTISNLNKVKNKALRKIKIRAAMIGANVVYLSSDHTEGARYNAWTGGSNTAEVILTGVAYSNRIVNIEDFKKMINEKSIYKLSQIIQMPFNKKTPTIKKGNDVEIDMSNYIIDGLFINVTYDNEQFKIINIDNNQIILMKEGKRRTYNYILK
ncbi:hypothetical protein ABXT64_01000 [Candidatus Marifrigoribacter sp. Uisw_064]|jgi:hypothetical protein|uniref:hypothetical protein n=1 Tax=Candidatus Marifrigoribacter sp. Uisw_064 TaxID=3230970 RepID=UPI003D5077ED